MALFVPKDRKSLFRQFLAGMYDAVVITDPNGYIIEINARAVEHFGYEQDDVIDKHISLFVNDYTISLGEEGRRAVERLLDSN